MDHLIPVINKLQDVFSTIGSQPIDLPQIAVIGGQSVGKSSVLENIVGRDFLPRGSNIVTRRPLILQLFNTSKRQQITLTNSESSDAESDDKMDLETDNSTDHTEHEMWGEFLHKGKKKYYDFAEIRKEIETETERIAPNKAISSQPINLKIYSPNLLNLTLIDLPGMTKIAVGNQPKNIENIVHKLIMSFIKSPKCLILAVSSASQDLATSDALKLAKSVDPKGLRTLGVITKIDLMDSGLDAMDMLCGNVIPLRLGYIGVVNRSQKDITTNKSITDAKLSEQMFFKNNPNYRQISGQCGTAHLSLKLNKILINHIKKCLPEMRMNINSNITDLESELRSYGNVGLNENKGALLLELISKFTENFTNLIDGSGVTKIMNQKLRDKDEQLFGGARILYIFNTEFKRKIYSIKPFDGLSDKFILLSMRNASGIRSSLFIPEMCFENLVKIQIDKLRRPCLECVDLVYNELKRITSQSETVEITRFRNFNKALNATVSQMLCKYLEPTLAFVNQSIDIELAYIKTNHPDFISMDDVFRDNEQKQQYLQGHTGNKNSTAEMKANSNKKGNSNKKKGWICEMCTLENEISNEKCQVCEHLRPSKQSRNSHSNSSSNRGGNAVFGRDESLRNMHNPPSQREKMELLVIKKFIHSYFEIVKRNICDMIPKSIMFLLVNQSKSRLSQELALSLYKKDKFKALLSESPQITKKRKTAQDLLQILKKALKIINNVNDYRISNY